MKQCWNTLHLVVDDLHLPVHFKLHRLPVDDVPPLDPLPTEQVLDDAVRQNRVPHVHVGDLPNKTLGDVKAPQEGVGILTQHDPAPRADGVVRPVDFGQTSPAVQEQGSCTWTVVPGEAQVGLQGAELGDLEGHCVSTQVEGQSVGENTTY